MKISNFTFIVTDACNFRCTYCIQKKENKTINNATIDQSVDFFYPFFKSDERVNISFYGGEPLLAYTQVKRAAESIMEKNKTGHKDIRFGLTTNGSLLTDEMLDFFNRHGFSVMLSFDGLAQDLGRKTGTLEKMGAIIKRIRSRPDIDFEINSVFTPQTVPRLSESIRYLVETGSSEITFCLATTEQWGFLDLAVLKEELERLSGYLLSRYQQTGSIPVKNFQVPVPRPGTVEPPEPWDKMPGCSAGRGHMAVTPEGLVWGCFMFHDYFKSRRQDAQYKDYSFGTLADFITDYHTRFPEIAANYTELRQDYFKVKESFCFTCEEVESCMVCPVNAAYTSGSIGQVSCSNCQLSKVERKARRTFRDRLKAA